MIKVGKNTWETMRRYALEIGIIALRNAADREVADDPAGENEWRKVMVRADVLSAIAKPLRQKPTDDQVTGVWEFDDEPLS